MSTPESIRALLNQMPGNARLNQMRNLEAPKTPTKFKVESGDPNVHFYRARALFNLAIQAADSGRSENALILLTEATSEAQKEVSVLGASWKIVAVLTQVFGLKVKILSQRIIRAGLDSSKAQILREALGCQIVCAEKLHAIRPNHDTVRMLTDLREIRLKLRPSQARS